MVAEALKGLTDFDRFYEQRIGGIRDLQFSEQTLGLGAQSSVDDYILAHRELQAASAALGEYRDFPFQNDKIREKIGLVERLEAEYPKLHTQKVKMVCADFRGKKTRFDALDYCNPGVAQGRKELEAVVHEYWRLQEIGDAAHTQTPPDVEAFQGYLRELGALEQEIHGLEETFSSADWEHERGGLAKKLLERIRGGFFSGGLAKRCKDLKSYEGFQSLQVLENDLKHMEQNIKAKHDLCKRIEGCEKAMRVLEDKDVDKYLGMNSDAIDEKCNSLYLRETVARYHDTVNRFQTLLVERKKAIQERQAKIQEIDNTVVAKLEEKIDRRMQELGPKINGIDTAKFSFTAFLDKLETPSAYHSVRNILQGIMSKDYERRFTRCAEALDAFKGVRNEQEAEYLVRLRSGLERALTQGALRQHFTYGKIKQEAVDKVFAAVDRLIIGWAEENA